MADPCADPTTEERLRKAEAVAEALDVLVSRLLVIHDDPTYTTVWMLYDMHMGPYRGPTYTQELDAARAALRAWRGEKDG